MIGSNYGLGSYNIFNISDHNLKSTQVGETVFLGTRGGAFAVQPFIWSSVIFRLNNITNTIYSFFSKEGFASQFQASYGSVFDKINVITEQNFETTKYLIDMSTISGSKTLQTASQLIVTNTETNQKFSIIAQSSIYPDQKSLCTISEINTNNGLTQILQFPISIYTIFAINDTSRSQYYAYPGINVYVD